MKEVLSSNKCLLKYRHRQWIALFLRSKSSEVHCHIFVPYRMQQLSPMFVINSGFHNVYIFLFTIHTVQTSTVLSRSSFFFVQWKVYVCLPNLKQLLAVIFILPYAGFFSANIPDLFYHPIQVFFLHTFLSAEIIW